MTSVINIIAVSWPILKRELLYKWKGDISKSIIIIISKSNTTSRLFPSKTGRSPPSTILGSSFSARQAD